MRKIEINTDFWNTVIISENASKCHGEFVFPNWHYWRRALQNVALFHPSFIIMGSGKLNKILWVFPEQNIWEIQIHYFTGCGTGIFGTEYTSAIPL